MNKSNNILGRFLPVISLSFFLTACSNEVPLEQHADAAGHTPATEATIKANQRVLETLPFSDRQDFIDARRGLVAKAEGLVVTDHAGNKLWNMPAYDFVAYDGKQAEAPASVNPSLWRQAALNNIHGLFKLTDGIYQLRGFDLANMSIIEGKTGWILVDPLTSEETAAAAFRFAQKHLGEKPVTAIIFTHSHIDHFGGAQGILDLLSEAERDALRIIAPEGFIEEATSENVIAGTAMGRRASYMYGKLLDRSERGHVDSGLGKGPAFGTFSIAEPTELVGETPTRMEIDSVPFVFQYTPGAEAPAEFTFYLPEHKAFCGAEVVSRTMHNLYTLRGAKVRDAVGWSQSIEEARQMFAQAELYFGSHHWPLWGNDRIQTFLGKQRDAYKYIHDQTVRMINDGLTPNEIADRIQLPESLSSDFSVRGYYGTVKHNAKAIYQTYMGWFNGNPALLDPLPEEEAARRYVQLMGGADAVVEKAQVLFTEVDDLPAEQVNKEYRWIAQLLNQAVFAEPDHVAARALLAKTYDQLGYQAESAPWRDFYLSGAYELRHGNPDEGMNLATMRTVFMHTPVEEFFKSMAVRLDGIEAEEVDLKVKIHFTDLNETYLLKLENAVLRHIHLDNVNAGNADATLNLTRPLFVDLIIGKAGISDLMFNEDLSFEGSKLDLIRFFALLDKPAGVFQIAAP
ncbi:alkyl/aryl-sulfatase [Pontibacterium sp.]|uniref:alkyl/aryl-sulfatase n=1 Tax=Pontibacterium sp. TaxID=2036026 RepID=UPI003517B404